MTTKAALQEAAAEFRQHLPDLSIPRFTVAKEQDPYQYADEFKKNHVPPWLFNLTEAWKELLLEPFKGVTSDGMSATATTPLLTVLSYLCRKLQGWCF